MNFKGLHLFWYMTSLTWLHTEIAGCSTVVIFTRTEIAGCSTVVIFTRTEIAGSCTVVDGPGLEDSGTGVLAVVSTVVEFVCTPSDDRLGGWFVVTVC